MKKKITDGHIEDGTHVEVWHDPTNASWISPYGKYEVLVDGRHVEVMNVGKYRDGGTILLSLEGSGSIIYPHRLHNPDRTPRYNKQPIGEAE